MSYKKKIAIFPGSFDPITIGHKSIINRACLLFDIVIVAVGTNSSKTNMFSLEQRKKWITNTFKDKPNIKIAAYYGLTVDFCKTVNANYIIRGLRSSQDLDYEQGIGVMNKALNNKIETIFFLSEPEHSMISSTIIRDIIKNKGSVEQFLPSSVNFDNLI